MSLSRFICLYCDGTGTLMRLKPHPMMACRSCVKERGGVENILAHVPDLNAAVEKWQQREKERMGVMHAPGASPLA